jgi:altronate hydrolase
MPSEGIQSSLWLNFRIAAPPGTSNMPPPPAMAHSIQALKIHPDDNVYVALADLQPGKPVNTDGQTLEVCEPVPAKHKFTPSALPKGAIVRMYGVTVGETTQDIPKGGLLTRTNLVHKAEGFQASDHKYDWAAPDVSAWEGRTFMGYHREDGSVGTANHWVFLPMVFCENKNIQVLRDALVQALGYEATTPYQDYAGYLAKRIKDGASMEEISSARIESLGNLGTRNAKRLFKNIDGVQFLTHNLGCGGTRQDANSLCGLLAGYVTSPNVVGATILALGCENAELETLKKEIYKRAPNITKPVLIFEQQKCASEQEMITSAIRETILHLAKANECERNPAPLSKLLIGTECGASDGFSGISANPTIGACVDRLVALGGGAILSEFPELCGVEQSLVNRCQEKAVAERFIQIMRDYAAQAKAVGSGFDMNPSPGNIRDGLITDAIKSAGAAEKGGTSPVVDVLDYPEKIVRTSGLNLLCTPGNDLESTTAMAAAGANLILFSTGLGTPTGNPVTPVIKISTNNTLANTHPEIIDFNTGPIITGEKTVDEMGAELLDLCISAASGEYITTTVRMGQNDFLPWKRGVSL